MINSNITEEMLFKKFKRRFLEKRFENLRDLIVDEDNISKNIYKIFKESAILCGQEYFGCSESNFNEFFRNNKIIISDLIPHPYSFDASQYVIEKKGNKIKYYNYREYDVYQFETEDLAEFYIDEDFLEWDEWFAEHNVLFKSITDDFEKRKSTFRKRIEYIDHVKNFLEDQNFRFITIKFYIEDFVFDDKKFLECQKNLDQILKKNWAIIGFHKLPKEFYWFNKDKEIISYFVHDRNIWIYENRFETSFQISYKYKSKNQVIKFDYFNDYKFLVNYIKDHYDNNIVLLLMEDIDIKYNENFNFYRIIPKWPSSFHFTDLPVRTHQDPMYYRFPVIYFHEKKDCIALKLERKTEKSQWVYIKDISEIFPILKSIE